jgi:hypothetical protein
MLVAVEVVQTNLLQVTEALAVVLELEMEAHQHLMEIMHQLLM